MINALGSAGLLHAIDARRADRVKASAPAAKAAPISSDESAPATAAATLAAGGASIDESKVGAIKAALAAGTYALDPGATAEAMIAADLPLGR